MGIFGNSADKVAEVATKVAGAIAGVSMGAGHAHHEEKVAADIQRATARESNAAIERQMRSNASSRSKK